MRTRRSIAIKIALLGGAVTLATACSTATAAPTWTYPPASAAPVTTIAPGPAAAAVPITVAQPAATLVTRLDLAVVTGGMIGHKEFPAFVPSDVTLPANATVIVTVTNFDDATALPKGAEKYATVSGTDGNTISVTPIKAATPNESAGTTQVLAALDPAAVSHTFTVEALGINVPIPAHARVTFTIHTGAAGTFAWRCYDPCGADPMGWGTAMAAKSGFMEGTLTIV